MCLIVVLENKILPPPAIYPDTFSNGFILILLSCDSFGECANTLDTASQVCKDLKLCVTNSTTFVSVVKQFFPPENVVLKNTIDEVVMSLREGECNALAGGIADVSRTTVVKAGGFTEAYEIGTKRFTKDPLALVTRQDDDQWSSFVYWVVSAIFFAEEEGIGQLQSLQMPLVNLFGTEFSSMFRNEEAGNGDFLFLLTTQRTTCNSVCNSQLSVQLMTQCRSL